MLTVLIILIAISIFSVFVYQLTMSVLFAWYMFLGATAFTFIFGSNQATIGGVHLDPFDVTALGLLVAGAVRFSYRRHLAGTMRIVSLAFVCIFVCSLVRGMLLYGVISASNDARAMVGELVAMLYFTTIPTSSALIKKMVTGYLWLGVALLLVALLHYAGISVGATATLTDNLEKNRALPAAAAQVIALSFFLNLGWISHRKSSLPLRILPAAFAGLAVVLQHRTVWNVLLAGTIALFFIDTRMIKRFAPAAVLAGVVVVLLGIGIYGSGAGASDEFADSANNSGTWAWRVNTWESLVFDVDQTPLSILVGKPVGTPFVHYEPGIGYEYLAPHSEYVELYLRVGVIGTILFLVFLLRPIWLLFGRHRRNRLSTFPSPSTWYLVVIGMVVYGVTYSLDASGVVLLGIANALVLAPEEEREEMLFANMPTVSSSMSAEHAGLGTR